MIAVDVDEVLFPFIRGFVAHDNALHGGTLHEDDFATYKFEDVIDIPFDEAVERIYDFNGASHDHIEPLETIDRAIDRLSESYELAIVTARHPQFADNTVNWLQRHFGDSFKTVVHVGFAALMEKPRKKVEVCQELGAIALIDDSLEHVSECSEQGIEGILFGNYRWNQTQNLPNGVTRCKNWAEILDYFDGRA